MEYSIAPKHKLYRSVGGRVVYDLLCVRARAARAGLERGLPRSIAIVLVGAALSGCAVTSGQLSAAATFGKSASTLADGAKSAYAQAQLDEANLRTSKYVVLNYLQNFDPSPIKKGDYKTPLIRLGPKDIPGRYAAANALAAYGQALTTLLDSKTQESDLATATGKLTTSLKSIPAKTLAQAGITSADITDLGNLITSFGDIYLDFRREQVLEQVVPKAEPIVTKLCTLFERDFDTKAGMFGTIYSNNLNNVIISTEESLNRNASDLQARAILLPIYQQTTSVQTQMITTFGDLNAAAKSCMKTSVAFADSIKDPTLSLDDIVDFATKAQAAYDAVTAAAAQK